MDQYYLQRVIDVDCGTSVTSPTKELHSLEELVEEVNYFVMGFAKPEDGAQTLTIKIRSIPIISSEDSNVGGTAQSSSRGNGAGQTEASTEKGGGKEGAPEVDPAG